ncbi:MAG: type IVB secretion system protein IcmM/DotJ [Legionella sp.]
MSRETWSTTKQSKHFYVYTYRFAGGALVISMIMNLCIGLAIMYTYSHQPVNDFYATDGVTPPVQLTYMDQPNNTSTPILGDDADEKNESKLIPQ